ncbi:MAG: HYR domain-containing protein, partial [Armatimonadetes bacterium]|nr:HYR domain-containing protein [Armatimonadota bacterium]
MRKLALLTAVISAVVGLAARPAAAASKISGTVTIIDTAGQGLGGVLVTLTPGGKHDTTADPAGTYTIAGVANGLYTATPTKPSWVFAPLSRSVTVSGSDVAGIDFVASGPPQAKIYYGGSYVVPSANIHVEQSELGGTPMTLDASNSVPDGYPITAYLWEELVGGSWVALGGAGTLTHTFELGGHPQVRLTATNSAGSASETIAITIQDTTAPSIAAPAAVTAEQTSADGTPVDLGEPTVSDICDAAPIVINDAPAVFPLGTTVVTWTATDFSGRAASATQNVVVVDTTAPELAIPADPAAVEQLSADGAPVDIGTATATDICDAEVTITNDAPEDGVYPLGATVVTWTATDDYGNSVSAEQTVTVVDTTDPELTIPADPAAVEQLSADGAPVDIGTATATDIC